MYVGSVLGLSRARRPELRFLSLPVLLALLKELHSPVEMFKLSLGSRCYELRYLNLDSNLEAARPTCSSTNLYSHREDDFAWVEPRSCLQ